MSGGTQVPLLLLPTWQFMSETAPRLTIDHLASVTQTLREPICQGDNLFCTLKHCVSENVLDFSFMRSRRPDHYGSERTSKKKKKEKKWQKTFRFSEKMCPKRPFLGWDSFVLHPAKLKASPRLLPLWEGVAERLKAARLFWSRQHGGSPITGDATCLTRGLMGGRWRGARDTACGWARLPQCTAAPTCSQDVPHLPPLIGRWP